jgi:hypothetical protein
MDCRSGNGQAGNSLVGCRMQRQELLDVLVVQDGCAESFDSASRFALRIVTLRSG